MPQPNLGLTSLAKHESAAKFLPSYLSNSPSSSAVCLSQRQWEILSVGSVLTLLLIRSRYFQSTNSLSVATRGNSCADGCPHWHLQTAKEPGQLLQSASTPPSTSNWYQREYPSLLLFIFITDHLSSNSSVTAHTFFLPTAVAESSRSSLPIL